MTNTELKKYVAALPRPAQVAFAAIVIERTLQAAVPFVDSDVRILVREVLNALWSYLAGSPLDAEFLESLHGRLDDKIEVSLGKNWEEGEEPNQPVLFAMCCSCTLPIAALRWQDKPGDAMGAVLDHYFDVWNRYSDIDFMTYNRERFSGEVTWAEHIVKWLVR